MAPKIKYSIALKHKTCSELLHLHKHHYNILHTATTANLNLCGGSNAYKFTLLYVHLYVYASFIIIDSAAYTWMLCCINNILTTVSSDACFKLALYYILPFPLHRDQRHEIVCTFVQRTVCVCIIGN